MKQCQCPDASVDHSPGACRGQGRYEIKRDGKVLNVCGSCKLSSDIIIADHICGRCGREAEILHRINGPMDPDTGYVDSEEVCGDCIDQMELDSDFQRS